MNTDTIESDEAKVVYPSYDTKPYTPWRRALAWIGFVAVLLFFPALVTLVMWGNDIVDSTLKQAHADVDMRQVLIKHCAAIGGEAIYDANYPSLIECDFSTNPDKTL